MFSPPPEREWPISLLHRGLFVCHSGQAAPGLHRVTIFQKSNSDVWALPPQWSLSLMLNQFMKSLSCWLQQTRDLLPIKQLSWWSSLQHIVQVSCALSCTIYLSCSFIRIKLLFFLIHPFSMYGCVRLSLLSASDSPNFLSITFDGIRESPSYIGCPKNFSLLYLLNHTLLKIHERIW